MKASDTVMDETEKLGCSLIGGLPYKDYKTVIDEVCLHQAEISFKVGIKEGREEERQIIIEILKLIKESKK